MCRQIALEAGRHGKTIGKDLIAFEMDRTGHTHSSHYSEDERGSDTRPDILIGTFLQKPGEGKGWKCAIAI